MATKDPSYVLTKKSKITIISFFNKYINNICTKLITVYKYQLNTTFNDICSSDFCENRTGFSGTPYFLTPIDTIGINQSQLADDSIDLKSSVLDPLTNKKVKLTLALIDACRDNPFLKTTSTRSTSNSRGLAPTTPATGQLIVYSAGSGQTALDRLGPDDKDKNGVFTRVLLSEMKKNNAPIHQVIRNVRSEVVKLARSIGHDQVPAIYDQVDGDFYFKK
jgi:hypothetical protein